MPRLLFALTGMLSLVLTGCTSDNAGTAAPTTSATATIEATSPPQLSPAGTRTVEPAPGVEPERNPQPATIDPSTIRGLGEVTDSRTGAPFNYDVTYPTIAGLDVFNAAVAAEIQRQLDQFAERVGTPTPLPDGRVPQELTLTATFLVASGDVIGVRLDTFRFFGANGAVSSMTLWYDGNRGAVVAGGPLHGELALEILHAAVADAMARERPDDPLNLGSVVPTAKLYDSLGFDASGRLIITFDEGEIGPTYLGLISVATDRVKAEDFLSDFGRQVREETLNPSATLAVPESESASRAPPREDLLVRSGVARLRYLSGSVIAGG